MTRVDNEFEKISWMHIAPLVLYLLLSPIYLIPSGLPQLADGFILFGLVGLLFSSIYNSSVKMRTIFFVGSVFAMYTVCINIINYLYFPHSRFLLSSLFYPYNVLVFMYTVKLLEQYGDKLRQILFSVIAVAVIGQFIWAVATPQEHWREIGSFNNPNQLAYWSLLSATMIVLLRQNKKLGFVAFGLLLLLGILQVLALSKAGIISYFVFLVILFFSPLMAKTRILFVLLLAVSAVSLGAFSYMNPHFKAMVFEKPIARLYNIGAEPDDSAEARGYYRPIKFPIYVLLGAGEGAYDRFEPENPVELHSGLVTIVFSYGLIGVCLFGGFLLLVVNKKPPYILLFFIPVLMFGLTGQSFRFSHFWIFLALAYLSSPSKQEVD
jgi:hypothetical protein